jgi:hypothetical protein
MSELVGAMMIAVLFAGVFVYAVIAIGVRGALIVFASAVAITGWATLALWLLNGGGAG